MSWKVYQSIILKRNRLQKMSQVQELGLAAWCNDGMDTHDGDVFRSNSRTVWVPDILLHLQLSWLRFPSLKASQTTNPGYVGRDGGSMDIIEKNTSALNDIMMWWIFTLKLEDFCIGAKTKSDDRQTTRLSKVKHQEHVPASSKCTITIRI